MCPNVEGFIVEHKQSARSLFNSHAWTSSIAHSHILGLNKEKLLLQRFQLLQAVNYLLGINYSFVVCHRIFIVIYLTRELLNTGLSNTHQYLKYNLVKCEQQFSLLDASLQISETLKVISAEVKCAVSVRFLRGLVYNVAKEA